MFRRVVRTCLLAGALASGLAHADAYDLRLSQLGNPQQGGTGYSNLAEARFRTFVRQLGAAITSVNLAPPETLGHSAFAVSGELSVVDLQGGSLPTQQAFAGPLLIPSVHFRKGLPASFELGARVAWIEKSRMGAGTLEFKWALNEGFAYLPDIGVRGSVTKLMNGRDLDLTTGGFDLGVGKQIAIGGMMTVTPYGGWNLLFVGASTGNIDFNPGRSLAEADHRDNKYKDYWSFTGVQAAANSHHRFYGGLRVIGGVVMLGAEVSYSLLGDFADETSGTTVSVPNVLAGNFTLGLDF